MHSTTHPNKPIIRRKPQYTYKSPSAQEWNPMTPLASSQSLHNNPLSSKTSTKNSASPSNVSKPIKHKRSRMSPVLPLYHPMGSLAMSLPPLDPAVFGLPSPVTSDDNHTVHGSSSHVTIRNSAINLGRDPDEKLTVGTIAAAAAHEVTEKASSRKRRSGGGSKRKRKDVDDGDATYPTRRTRLPRSAIHQAVSEEPVEEAAAIGAEEGEDLFDEKKPERRTTRSRGNPGRCDSSLSDSGSATLSLGAPNPTPSSAATVTTFASIEVKDQTSAPHILPKVGNQPPMNEKEDGELSDEETK